jgi:hypothetical protein
VGELGFWLRNLDTSRLTLETARKKLASILEGDAVCCRICQYGGNPRLNH